MAKTRTPKQKEQDEFQKSCNRMWKYEMTDREKTLWGWTIASPSEIEIHSRVHYLHDLFPQSRLKPMVRRHQDGFNAYNKLTRSFGFSAPRPCPPKVTDRPDSTDMLSYEFIPQKGFDIKLELELSPIYCIYHILTSFSEDELRKYPHWVPVLDVLEKLKDVTADGKVKFEYRMKGIVSGEFEMESGRIYVNSCPITLGLTPPQIDPAKYKMNVASSSARPDIPPIEGSTLMFEAGFVIDKLPDCYHKGEYVTVDLTKITAGSGRLEFASGIATHTRRCPMFSVPDIPHSFLIKPAGLSKVQPQTKTASQDAIKDLTIRRIVPSERPKRSDMQDK